MTHWFCESCSVEKVLLIKFYNCRELCEALISNQVEAPSPRYDIVTDFTIFAINKIILAKHFCHFLYPEHQIGDWKLKKGKNHHVLGRPLNW